MTEHEEDGKPVELDDKQVQLMIFVADEIRANGTCPFEKARNEFEERLIMEMMFEHGLITYDGKTPLGLRWSDIAVESFSLKPQDKSSASVGIGIHDTCDMHLFEVNKVPADMMVGIQVPTEGDISSIKVGQAVKCYAEGEFIWMEVTERAGNLFRGKVVGEPDLTELHDINKGDILQFCQLHICDAI